MKLKLMKDCGVGVASGKDNPKSCRVFIFATDDFWIYRFSQKLSELGWKIKFALNIEEFNCRFSESETDVLILRGIDDLATLKHSQSLVGFRPSCGLIWIYSGREFLNSPYFRVADHRVPLETSDIELMAIAESVFKLLKRCGWR